MKNCHVAYVDLAGAVTAIANFPWISASAPGYMRYASTVPVLSRYPADTSACSSALSYSGCDSIKLPQGTPSDLRTAAPDRHVPLRHFFPWNLWGVRRVVPRHTPAGPAAAKLSVFRPSLRRCIPRRKISAVCGRSCGVFQFSGRALCFGRNCPMQYASFAWVFAILKLERSRFVAAP